MKTINPQDFTKNNIAELEGVIRYHQRLYYDLNEPEISDQSFDALWERLIEIAPDSHVLKERSQFDADYPHLFPMGSLEKCKTVEDVVRKLGGKSKTNRGTITAKLDGSSLTIHYENGRFVRALTRGRTETGKGKVVTANALKIPSIPMEIPCKDKLEVRGEGVILLPDWATIADKYSNPRNAASGGLSCQDPRDTEARKLTFVACKLIRRKPGLSNPISSKDESEGLFDIQPLETLESWGFLVPKHVSVDLSSVSSVKKAIETWSNERNQLPYWNDGIVIRIEDDMVYNDLGFSGVCPKGACAYKFENETAESVIRDIIWTTGRMGFVSPVAIFDPVQLGGAKISKCTLNNPTWMKDNGNPTIGSRVVIAKMNDIIPNVIAVLSPGTGETKQPTDCPACGASLSFANVNDGEGAKLKCFNEKCTAKFKGSILNALQKFEVRGIAEKSLEDMVDSGLLKNPWDIFDLTEEKLISSGWGKRESEIAINAVKGIETSPAHVLAAIGIEMWGKRMFQKLQANSVAFTDERLLAGDFPYDELSRVPEIGPTRAMVLSEAFKEGSEARIYLNELLKRIGITKKASDVNVSGGKLSGMTFCLSGSMPRGKKQIESDIVANGGIVKDSVNKELSYLVSGEGSGSKSEKAKKYGVKIINEDELYAMMG